MFGVALLLIFVWGDIVCGFGIWFVGVVIAGLVAFDFVGVVVCISCLLCLIVLLQFCGD